jgi:hypothetical protein
MSLIAIEVNTSGNFQGFCPKCFGVNIKEKIIDNKQTERLFKKKKYICWNCKETFNELAKDYYEKNN